MSRFLNDTTTQRWLLALAWLAGIGFLALTSAQVPLSLKLYGHPAMYALKQGFFLIIAAAVLLLSLHIPSDLYRRYAWPAWAGLIVLLLCVFLPGLGGAVNGASRWLHLKVFALQPSEFAKVILPWVSARVLTPHALHPGIGLATLGRAGLAYGVIVFLIMLQPDFGMTTLISGQFAVGLWMSPLTRHFFFYAGIAAAFLGSLAVMLAPYRMARVLSYWDPWGHQFSSGYQLTQSLLAIGHGGWWGQGLGRGHQKWSYLPEAHTDFIFSAFVEEWGAWMALAYILFWIAILAGLFQIARRCYEYRQVFQGHLVVAYACGLALQLCFHLGVNVGLLPTKGMTLPWMSYGGSSLLITALQFGILLRIDYDSRQLERKENKLRHG